MSEVEATALASQAESPKGKKGAKKREAVASISTAKPKAKPAHPPVHTMVDAAIKSVKERRGSSLLAIKKYIAVNYTIETVDKLAPYIKKYLKNSVTSGKLVQTKGTGASGSFRFPKDEGKAVEMKPKAAAAAQKPKAAEAAKKPKTAEKVKPKAKPAVERKKAVKKAPATPTGALGKKKAVIEKAKAAPKSANVPNKKTKMAKVSVEPKTPKPKKKIWYLKKALW